MWHFFVLQFQFVNSYLSLFYIGFYLKDMERLKEVGCNSISALMFFCHALASVIHLASSINQSPILTFCALSAHIHWFSVTIHPLLHPFAHLWKMVLALCLSRSLQRQVQVNLLPFFFFKIQMLVVSVPWFFRALLKSKVWCLFGPEVKGQRLTSSALTLFCGNHSIN